MKTTWFAGLGLAGILCCIGPSPAQARVIVSVNVGPMVRPYPVYHRVYVAPRPYFYAPGPGYYYGAPYGHRRYRPYWRPYRHHGHHGYWRYRRY